MDFTNIPLMNAMSQKLKYNAQRQNVLAQNIANVDTPAYKAMDIAAPDFKAMLARASGGKMTVTNPMHIQPGMSKGGNLRISERENTYETNPDGNNVVIEEETMKVAENQSDYQTVLSMYRKTIEMFRTALGRSGAA